MTALVGLTIGMVLGIVGRELWSWHRGLPSKSMEQICRDLASDTDEHTAAALLEIAENYRKAVLHTHDAQ